VRRAGALLWGILGLAAFLRFAAALRRPLQVDEGYSLHVASLPLGDGLRILRELDVHPPLYLFLLHAWVSVHLPDIAFRLGMAAVGVASVAMLYAIVRLWHGQTAALVAAGCAAVMPSLIFYDAFIRMYAPFDALALASFLILSVLYTTDTIPSLQRRLLWVAWAICCTLLLYTLYLGFIIIATQLLYAAVARREGLMRSLVGAGAAFILWLPQLSTFIFQLPRGGLAFPFYAQHQFAALFELPGQATIAVQTHGGGYVVAWASLLVWLWLVLALAIALPGNARSLCLWLVVPAVLTLLYGVAAHKLLYTDRYYLVFAYGLCATTGIAIARLTAAPRSTWLPGVWVAAGALVVTGLGYAFYPPLYTADWPNVGNLLRARTQSGDVIVFEQGSPLFVLERGDSLDHHPLIVVLRRNDVDAAIRLTKSFRRIWLILFQSGPLDPSGKIVRALATKYQPAGVWEFNRWLPAETATVVLFERHG
jgi:uncharacterized membrane protein